LYGRKYFIFYLKLFQRPYANIMSMRRLFFFFLISFCLLPLFRIDTGRAEAVFFDVGQGDAFALKTPQGKIIVVDGGPDWSSLKDLERWLGFGRQKIDFLILSHGHDDHLAALPEIAARFKVKNAFLPARLSGSAAAALLEALKKDGAVVKYPAADFCLLLETDCSLCLFPPAASFLKSKDENDLSLALHFDCAGLSVAAAGDASQAREKSLLSSDFVWSAQILKISHHGSDSANDPSFQTAISPDMAVISVGANNSYGHPSSEVVNRIKQAGIKIWRTDQAGSVLFYSNNSKIYFKKY